MGTQAELGRRQLRASSTTKRTLPVSPLSRGQSMLSLVKTASASVRRANTGSRMVSGASDGAGLLADGAQPTLRRLQARPG